mgnify:FL=1
MTEPMTREKVEGYAAEYQPGEPMGDLAHALLATMTELEQVKGERDGFYNDWDAALKIANRTAEIMVKMGADRLASKARAEAAETALAAMTEREGVLRSACAPFKDMAGEMFARNWNRDQVAIALDNPGDLHRLMFGDFLDLHAALQHKDANNG